MQLEDVVTRCESYGALTMSLPADTTDEETMRGVARRAIETFGRIDVWVNNAAVTLFGRFDEVPMADTQRVIETNLIGYVHGARAAMSYFREQGAGVLINVDSVVASAPQPYTAAYVSTKYAVRGFFECVRMELALDDAPDIHVCTVFPASIDTPLFQQGANYSGRDVKPLSPVYPRRRWHVQS